MVGVAEPDEEPDRLCDLLLRAVHRTPAPGSGPTGSADPGEVVPAGELLRGLTDLRVVDGGQFRGQPSFEQSQVVVAPGEELVCFQDAAQVLDAIAARFGIEVFVTQRDRAGGQLAQ